VTERASHALHLVGAAPPRLEVRLLGRFGLARDGRPVDLSGWQRRPAALLRLLAASGGRVTRDEVIERFWPESDPQKGATNLRQVLYQLRRELGANPPPVIVEAGWVALNPALSWEVDLAAFQAAVEATDDDPAALDAVLDLYGGEPLPEDRYEDWAAPVREQTRRTYREAVLRTVQLYRERGASEHTLKRLGALLEIDPLDEVAVRLQLELLAEAGRRADALKAYVRFKERLQSELELEPEPETVSLVDEISREDRTRPTRRPATTTAPPHNLPAALSSFVGRGQHVERLHTLLARHDVRLVTLTGPGGTGKTRLALEVARASVADHPDGAYLVSLAPLADAALVAPTVASVLGIEESRAQPILETIKEALSTQQVLLVLDNFEHLLPAAPQVSELLAACPGLTVLATSREKLHLSGEHDYPVPPLTLPRAESADPAEAAESEAVTLFATRAQAVRPEFALTSGNVAAVTEICRRLDGLPLAIELAAARITLFPPEVLLRRLDRRLKLLTGGARDQPTRQQTLRSAIDWSYSLLSPEEQTLFARLSIFAGGGSLEAAEFICANTSDGAMRVLDCLAALVDKHLLRQEGEDEPRFGMLETIREYAAERLGVAAEAEAVRRRHATYYLHLAEEAAEGIAGPDQGLWLDQLETEHDNVRSALAWFLDQRELDLAYRMANSVDALWIDHVHLSEARQWFSVLLSREGEVSKHLRATALRRASRFLTDRASESLTESLALYRELQDKTGETGTLAELADEARRRGDLDSASDLAEDSLALAREVGDRWIAYASQALGLVRLDQRKLDEARAMLEESVALFRKVGSPGMIAWALLWLTWVVFFQGGYERASALGEEALALEESIGNALGAGMVRGVLALAALERGEVERAATYANRMFSSVESGLIKTHTVEVLATLGVAKGDAHRAARLWGATDSSWLSSRSGFLSLLGDYYARYKAAGRAQVGEEAWARAWQEGRAMSLEQALVYALQGGADPLVPAGEP
jgi:predicted ATPase/DNA-binding SARP family transcriptional activator